MSKKETILEEASRITTQDRNRDYGHPYENHSRTARMWSAYLGVAVSPRDVCNLNALQKVSRDRNKAKRDNLVDLAGWARNAEMVEERAKQVDEELSAEADALNLHDELDHLAETVVRKVQCDECFCTRPAKAGQFVDGGFLCHICSDKQTSVVRGLL